MHCLASLTQSHDVLSILMHLSHSFGCLALRHTPKPIPLSHSLWSSFDVHVSDCRHPQLSSVISNSSSLHHSTSPFSVLTVASSTLIVLSYWWPSPNLSCGKSCLSCQMDVTGVDHITNNMASILYSLHHCSISPQCIS